MYLKGIIDFRCLEKIHEVCKNPSRVHRGFSRLMQNMCTKSSKNIVLRLLEDTSLEVRKKAAEVLGGLLHCSFLPATDKLLERFKKKFRIKVIRTTGSRRAMATCAPDAALKVIGKIKETLKLESISYLD